MIMIKISGQTLLKYYAFVLTSVLTFVLLSSYTKKEDTYRESAKVVHSDYTNLPQIIKPIDLEKRYDFATEPLPMQNFDVRERLERELLVNSYWHSSTMLNIKSSIRYFPVIEKILAENGIPDDFKYLAVAESNLRNETSPAGAKGYWQLMSRVARHYGLEINSEVDERFHIEKATRAACEYLKDYKRQFDSWTLSAAAYNMGGPNLKSAINKQKSDSYYDLNLNSETNRYLFRLVAFKEILSAPRNFGFFISKEDGYPPLERYKVVEVNGPIENLGNFARKNGTSYRMLKVFNPWLLSHQLTNPARKTYHIKIPY